MLFIFYFLFHYINIVPRGSGMSWCWNDTFLFLKWMSYRFCDEWILFLIEKLVLLLLIFSSSHFSSYMVFLLNVFLHFSYWVGIWAICFVSHFYYLHSLFIMLATKMIESLTSDSLQHLTRGKCLSFCIYLFISVSFFLYVCV